jgi:hypothetical protein
VFDALQYLPGVALQSAVLVTVPTHPATLYRVRNTIAPMANQPVLAYSSEPQLAAVTRRKP